MTFLVLGKSGQVAQALDFVAGERGLDVLCVGRPKVDFLDPTSVLSAISEINPSVVINAAAFTAVDPAEEYEAEALQINATAVAAVARLTYERGIPFIHLSTDYVFDGTKGDLYTEDDAVCPINAYGKTKLTGEQLVLKIHPRSFVFRVAWVYGPFGRTLWTTYLDCARENREFVGVDDQFSTPTPSLHLADCLLDLAERLKHNAVPDQHFGLYHLAGSEGISRFDMGVAFRHFCHMRGIRGAPVSSVAANAFGRVAVRPSDTRLSSLKSLDVLGLSVPCLREALHDFVVRVPAHAEDLMDEVAEDAQSVARDLLISKNEDPVSSFPEAMGARSLDEEMPL